jgi:hypothetical protein
VKLIALRERLVERSVLEVPHERSGVEKTDGGYAYGMGGGAQRSSLEDAERRTKMRRAIIGFEKDDEGHWVAQLVCGHTQHVRHDPPWTVREWVTTEEGRASRLGVELECKKCDEEMQ